MKKISIYLCTALIAGLSFTSCSKDDDGGSSVTKEKLVGKWNFKTEQFSGGGESLPAEDYNGNEAGCAADFIQVNADNTVMWGDYTSGCTLGTSTGSWTLDGKDVTINVDGVTKNYRVSSVSSTQLKVVEEFSQNGMTFKYTTVFEKAAAN